jgi:RNA polymerase sigma-70 factor (ECF subfamily)
MPDDQRLIDGYLNGESDSVSIVDGWLAAATAPFRSRLGADTDDLLQQVRMEVLRLLRAESFRAESSLKTYIWRVATHTSIDALRRARRRPAEEAYELGAEPESSAPSPLEAVLHRERQRLLMTVLETMSKECRELWELILQGYSYKELGRRLGVSEAALRVRAHRCRKRAVAALDGRPEAPTLESCDESEGAA